MDVTSATTPHDERPTEHTLRPYVLAETTWRAVKNQQFALAVLPWGATEAHNYHLPYGTDNYQVGALSEHAAGLAWRNGARVIVLPTIPFGVNTGQMDIALDMNIYPSTQQKILSDVAEVVQNAGIPRLLIVNGHGGNDFKPMIRELGTRYRDVFMATCNWYQCIDRSRYVDTAGDHADEMETSLMMYLRPGLVTGDMGEGKAARFSIDAFNGGWAWAERPWSKVTADTGIGDPRAADADKGYAAFTAITATLAQFFVELCDTPLDALFQ